MKGRNGLVQHQKYNLMKLSMCTFCGKKSEFYVALLIEDKWYQAAHQIKGESLAITKTSDSMDVAQCQVLYKAIIWAVKTEKLPLIYCMFIPQVIQQLMTNPNMIFGRQQ